MVDSKRKKLESWLNIPLTIETRNDKVGGVIKYGVRLHIRSANTPLQLQECEVGSKERIDGEKPAYWFVNDQRVLKVKLLTYKIKDEEIRGFGKDSEIFRYKIRRAS